jgi:hypothetical protein
MEFDEHSKKILQLVGVLESSFNNLQDVLIPREQLLSIEKYNNIKNIIPKLKTVFSSSCMTSLQKTAEKDQRWPLINLVRQILNVYNFRMVPIRKSDGYTPDGIKKYKRFFQIKTIDSNQVNN